MMLCSPWSFELSSICYGYTLSKKKKKICYGYTPSMAGIFFVTYMYYVSLMIVRSGCSMIV